MSVSRAAAKTFVIDSPDHTPNGEQLQMPPFESSLKALIQGITVWCELDRVDLPSIRCILSTELGDLKVVAFVHLCHCLLVLCVEDESIIAVIAQLISFLYHRQLFNNGHLRAIGRRLFHDADNWLRSMKVDYREFGRPRIVDGYASCFLENLGGIPAKLNLQEEVGCTVPLSKNCGLTQR